MAYIQSALKCKKGIGESFIHSYVFESVNSNEIIKFGLDDSEENEESLYLENKDSYCECIFKKIYYLFEKHLNLRLLQIKGEFLRDDNNRIWLIHASNIMTLPLPVPEVLNRKEIKPVQFTLDEDQLLNHLAQVAKQPKNHRTEKFSRIMNSECEKMIDATKIMDIFKPADPDAINISAFAKLRKFTPYNLEDLLDKDRAKTLLKVYTENKKYPKKDSEVKGINYDTPAATQSSFSPKKLTNSWIFTPKLSPSKAHQRPMSSTIRRKFEYTL